MAATAKVAGLAEMSLDTSDNGSDDDEEDEGDYEEDEGDLMDDFVEVEVEEDVIEVSKTVNYEQLYLLLKEMNAILACHEERTYKLVPQAQPTSFTRHFRFDAFFIASLLIHCRCYNPSMVASEFLRKDAGRKRRPQKSMSSRPVKRDRMDENLHAHAHPVLDPQVLSSAGFNENTYKTISEKCKSIMKNDGTPTAADLVRHCQSDLLGIVFDLKKMQKALPRNVNFPSSISTNGHALRIYYHEYEVLKVTKEQQEEKKKVFAKYKLKLRTLANARGKKFKLELKRLKKARKKNGAQDDSKEKQRKKEEDEKMEMEMDKADEEIRKAKDACKKFEDSNLYFELERYHKDSERLQIHRFQKNTQRLPGVSRKDDDSGGGPGMSRDCNSSGSICAECGRSQDRVAEISWGILSRDWYAQTQQENEEAPCTCRTCRVRIWHFKARKSPIRC